MARDIDKGEWRMPGFAFRAMSFFSDLGRVFRSPRKVLESTGIKEGDSVLDFGCGPGNYSLAAAEIVGDKGMVHALDIHPLALERVEERAGKRGIGNVETIFSDLETGLDRNSLDAVLLYGVLYRAGSKRALIREVSRILKQGGLASVSDPRMSRESLMSIMGSGGFSLRDSRGGIFNFVKKGKEVEG